MRQRRGITYRGHTTHPTRRPPYVDNRLGRVRAGQDGGLRLGAARGESERSARCSARAASAINTRAYSSQVSVFALLCRDAVGLHRSRTDLRRVDAIELDTGRRPAIRRRSDTRLRDAIATTRRWPHRRPRRRGGGRDSHDGGVTEQPLTERRSARGRRSGCGKLSERRLAAACRRATLAKCGQTGPTCASALRRGRRAIMGDTIRGRARVRLREACRGEATAVPGTRPYALGVQRDGIEVRAMPGRESADVTPAGDRAGARGAARARPLVRAARADRVAPCADGRT